MIHLIKEIKAVSPFRLTLLFNTGETIVVNLEDRLKTWAQSENSLFRKLLDPGYFKTVKFNEELETIYWDNGIDLCPDVLYAIGKETELKIKQPTHMA